MRCVGILRRGAIHRTRGLCGRRTARNGQNARSVAVDHDRCAADGLRLRSNAFPAQVFLESLCIGFAAGLCLRLGQLAVAAELDRRGIAELLGRRVRKELFFRAALGRAQGIFHILFKIGRKLVADADLHGQQDDADERANAGDRKADDQDRL